MNVLEIILGFLLCARHARQSIKLHPIEAIEVIEPIQHIQAILPVQLILPMKTIDANLAPFRFRV